MKNFNKKGFTLIEMLIVVVIIGILAAALIPRLTSVKDKANDSARKANLQQLVTAMSTYNLDNGVLNQSATGDTTTGYVFNALLSGGMKSIPTDPSNTAKLIFGKNTTGYVYFTMKKAGVTTGGFVFISRAETAGAANFVEVGGAAINSTVDMDSLTLCDKVTVQSTAATAEGCAGTVDQLRIIMKY